MLGFSGYEAENGRPTHDRQTVPHIGSSDVDWKMLQATTPGHSAPGIWTIISPVRSMHLRMLQRWKAHVTALQRHTGDGGDRHPYTGVPVVPDGFKFGQLDEN